ncbi:MAG TPA: D-alanyl-D-alanine carboxypeptidase/D-alanyl-D-alanine-endopeptidase, partial [Legionella sp.]|nr:D-alanyl-D-alanine carboxypeptidase/D-alanyl-D-alanine-endopeptidase [Legionella sp.]
MKRILFSAMLCLLSVESSATGIQNSLNRLINQVDPTINMGMEVVDLNTGETLYQRNATRAFTPASNMKLFSNAAALLVLGPDYRFQNQLSTDASSLDQGVLNGSIYLHLSGDPSFTQDHMDELFAQLNTWGIREIKGNVVLVSNHGAVNAYAPGLAVKDLTYGYGAPIAPLMIDENRVTVTINPAYRVGSPAIVELNAPGSGLVLVNQVNTAENASKCGIDYKTDAEGHLTVRGCVGLGQWAVQQRLAIRNPLQYAEKLISHHLAQLHVQLDGHVLLGNAPSSSLLLASHASKPINQLMADTLKPSDNLYADSLYLHAAAKLQGVPLNWAQAQPVVKKFLEKETGIPLEQAVLTDGSGLSRNDLLTPRQTVSLLRFLYDRFPLAYEYISALPVAGQDGTLQKRLRKITQQGLIRAKTGSMTGIMSLSGYVYTANAHTLAFSIFINTTPGTKPAVSGRYRYLVDAICDVLLAERPNNRIFASSPKAHARVAFQQRPNQADRIRNQQAKWRRIEFAVKQALHDQSVTVLFKNEQLVLIDHNANANAVWAVLQA